MVYCFIVDNNLTMESRCDSMSIIDVCKCAVEQFVMMFKLQGVAMQQFHNSLILLKTDNEVSCILCSLRDPFKVFEDGLKHLTTSNATNNVYEPLSVALNVVNQYRFRNGTDNVGKGWAPWLIEPTTIIYLTDGVSILSNPNNMDMLSSKKFGSDFFDDYLRWDTRIYTYVIGDRATKLAEYVNNDMFLLCKRSGGALIGCRNYHDTLQSMKDLAKQCNANFNALQIQLSLQVHEHHPPIQNAYITSNITPEWPIPENQWVDKAVDILLRRPAFPLLTIISPMSHATMPYSSEELRNMLVFMNDMNIGIDQFSLKPILESQPIESWVDKKMISKRPTDDRMAQLFDNKLSFFPVCVPHCDKNPTLTPFCGIIGPSLAADNNSSDIHVNSSALYLYILPYDFPQFIKLMRQVKDIANRMQCSTANIANLSKSLPADWFSHMTQYLQCVPLYYHPHMYKVLKTWGLHVCIPTTSNIAGNPSFQHIFSRNVHKLLTKIRNNAILDLNILESTDRSVRATPQNALMNSSSSSKENFNDMLDADIENVDCDDQATVHEIYNYDEFLDTLYSMQHSNHLNDHITSTSTVAHQTSLMYYTGNSINDGIVSVLPQHLLLAWERSRAALFGKKGLMVQGIYVAGIQSSAGGRVQIGSENDRDWLFRACGGATVPRVPLSEMSDFVTVLTHKESLRDPLLLDPPPDEGTPEEVFRRKLSIHFGSPYKKDQVSSSKKRSRSDSSVSDIGSNATPLSIDIEGTADFGLGNSIESGEAIVAFSDKSDIPIVTVIDNMLGRTGSPHKPPLPHRSQLKQDNSINNRQKIFQRLKRPIEKIEGLATTPITATTTTIATTISSISPNQYVPIKVAETSNKIQHVEVDTKPIENNNSGWIKQYSEKRQCSYWFNTNTGASRWTPPE